MNTNRIKASTAEWNLKKEVREVGRIYTPNKDYYAHLIIINPVLQGDTLAQVGSLFFEFRRPNSEERSYRCYIFQVRGRVQSRDTSHEGVHCATNYMRLFEKDKLKLNDDCDDNEERLAWLVGFIH